MQKLLLILPSTRDRATGFGESESWGMPPLALGYIAALTPPGWDIKIVDEYAQQIDFGFKPDLVGISAYTSNAPRAYDLCVEFKKMGAKVVMGGIHPSVCPEEAMLYADAIVVGEAENVWQEIIGDFLANRLKKKYEGKRPSLEGLPVPRRDLFSPKYAMDVILTSRGCPWDCSYCSISSIYGKEYRVRPNADIINELKAVKKKIVYFIDDNFFGTGAVNSGRILELCKGIIGAGVKKYWATQASLNIAEYPEVLKYAYKSGCRGIYVGIESIDEESLREYNKRVNLKLKMEGMKKAIKTIHDHGITVAGAFIFGSDNDNSGVFQRTLDFIKETGLDVVQLGVLTPYPGTPLFRKLSAENRIFNRNYPDDWEHYDTDNVNFKTARLCVVDLVRGFDYIAHTLFNRRTVLAMALKTLFKTRSAISAVLAYSLNYDSIAFFDYAKRFGRRKKGGK